MPLRSRNPMNQVGGRPPLAKRAMNAALWTIHVLLGVSFNIIGFGKVLIKGFALKSFQSRACFGLPAGRQARPEQRKLAELRCELSPLDKLKHVLPGAEN